LIIKINMLVFSGIVPHPPILIPSIGKQQIKKLDKTVEALATLEKQLNDSQPDTIIIITPHGQTHEQAFCVNTNAIYEATFKEFGDFETKLIFKPDLDFIMKLKADQETKLPVQLISQSNLDHGAAIPLYYLTRNNKNYRIVPINTSFLSGNKHVAFGQALIDAIFSSDRRYAIIASGDLSHRLSPKAPAGFSPKAKEFDKKLIQLLKKRQTENILNLDQELLDCSAQCGLNSILILLGALSDINYDFEVINYESPFGVGYLVAQFKLK